MSRSFPLEVQTLNRTFYQGNAESIIFDSTDGQLEVLAGHTPLISSLSVGELRIKIDGVWKSAFISEGFVDVRKNGVLVFAQACEWPDEIDEKRALSAKARAIAQLQRKQSISEHRHSQISLTRAMARLRMKNRHR